MGKLPELRRRKQASPGFKLLPHEGRKGEPPKWPLPEHPLEEMRALELGKWGEMWGMPQAVEWERMRDYGTVALYVRVFCEASVAAADPRLMSELRYLDSKIGVSAKAMHDLRWETDEARPEFEAEENGSASRLVRD